MIKTLSKLTLVPILSELISSDEFKDYISISSDSLLVIDKELNLVEWIVSGNDVNGYYFSAKNENDFLDAIIVLKNIILSGGNPFDYIESL
jgi:hypothetical protein